MNGRSGRRTRRALRCTAAAALALALAGGAAFAKDPTAPSDTTGGPETTCKTKLPQPMLGGADLATHEFHAFPANRATESGTFSDGAQLSIEVTGCAGPTLTTMVLVLPVAAAAGDKPAKPAPQKSAEPDRRPERKTVGPLVDYLHANLDMFAKTPLGLPNAGRALSAINEARMSYPEGDRICLEKDNPQVVPDAQRCSRVLAVRWSSGARKTYTITYSTN